MSHWFAVAVKIMAEYIMELYMCSVWHDRHTHTHNSLDSPACIHDNHHQSMLDPREGDSTLGHMITMSLCSTF